MINSDNILAYVKYLYQKKYDQVAPAQLLSQWRNVAPHEIRNELHKLYEHWGWSNSESRKTEDDFLQIAELLKPTTVTEPETIIIEKEVAVKSKRSRSIWAWIVPILLLGLSYSLYMNYQNDKKETLPEPVEKTSGTLLEEAVIEDTAQELVIAPDPIDTLPDPADPNEITFDDKQSMANIKSFIFAEDDRNTSKMFSLLSPNIYKYYDLNYPTESQLTNRYEHIWSITESNTNYITEVKKVDERKYQVLGTYEYLGLNTQEQKSLSTNLIFETDENNKIISIDENK